MKRNGKIDFYKFIMALVVMFLHSKVFALDENAINVTFRLFKRGGLAVEFFFIVSGYLMALHVFNEMQLKSECPTVNLAMQTQEFIVGKVRAIMPDYLIAWLISFIVMMVKESRGTISGIVSRILDAIYEPLLIHMSGLGHYRTNGVVWYISAMLISMAVIYPMLRRYFHMFTKVVAPLIAVILLGMIYRINTTTVDVTETVFDSFLYLGLVRAFAELCLGVACYDIIEKIKVVDFTLLGKVCISVMETVSFILALGYMQFGHSEKHDMVIILPIAIMIIFAFSHQGLLAKLFDNNVCHLMGRYSLSIYLSHVYWARLLGSTKVILPYRNEMILYVLLVFTNSVFLLLISRLISRNIAFIRSNMKRLIIDDEKQSNR